MFARTVASLVQRAYERDRKWARIGRIKNYELRHAATLEI